ncbi:phosphocarrier, HPr family [Shuttleworthella sp. MSX8B]|uniref:HPr family phosphocarrier protein n=1 Tax=Shuttleworthella sp. MSX8B TaxID=936574 RepID=UPI00044523DD|nr:HPr family phosphocarrier protein [Shuttleworthia sp. MSX8B]EUB14815.1 phosphocarrier, HPr family [Shuttleworthia sp. MSX8B]
MKSFEFEVQDAAGMHARPAGLLVKKAKEYESKVTIHFGDKSADSGRMMAIMSLGVKQGDTIRVDVEGPDEDKAANEMEAFFKENL